MIVRGFQVSEGREADFEKVFAPDGIWAEFLAVSGRYLGTEVRVKSEAERSYQVIDYWRSHLDFETFRREHQLEYEKFSQMIANEGLVERETVLGTFYEDGPDDEWTDLTPA